MAAQPDAPEESGPIAGFVLGGLVVLVVAWLAVGWLLGARLAGAVGLAIQVALVVVAETAYAVWAERFLKRGRAPPPPLEGPWEDRQLKAVLTTIGVLVLVAAVFFAPLVYMGACWEGCKGQDGLRPWAMLLLVPLLYLGFARLYLGARRRRAARDPAWAARAHQAGARVSVILSVLLLAGLALIGSCFGLVFLH